MRIAATLFLLAVALPSYANPPSQLARCVAEPTVLVQGRPSGRTNRPDRLLPGGHVIVRFTIDVNGHVRNPVVESSDPPKYFDGEALGVVKKWRYAPVQVPCYWTGRVDFAPILE